MTSSESPITPPPITPAQVPPALEARRLLRAARAGVIATSQNGQPFASLITPAVMADGALLVLVSRLSEHTRHLIADPRCSVMVTGAATSPNPQTTPRVTVTGQAAVTTDPALKARYLALHPYATLYADFTDFSTWRIAPAAGLLVAGFGRAQRLRQADLLPEPPPPLAAHEAEIIAHCNQVHPSELAAIAGAPGDWQMVTLDADGFDLAQNEQVVRIAWPAPLRDPAGVRPTLLTMANAARG